MKKNKWKQFSNYTVLQKIENRCFESFYKKKKKKEREILII